jgi:eukaryotic-like serine/threonine-protein kinase
VLPITTNFIKYYHPLKQNKMLKNYALLFLFAFGIILTACKEDETIPKSSAKAITKLTFPQFTPAVQATIDETTKRITAVVPPTADITKLIPSISVSLKAKVLPDSGKVQDFTNEVTYTVTAEDGTKQDYKVMVSRTKFSGKDITEFSFADFSPAIVAKIDPTTKTITATVPATADLTKLKPTLKLSDRATVNPALGTVVDFSKAVNFTVTAEDAGTQVYAVTVVKEIPIAPAVSIISGQNPSKSVVYIANGGGFAIKALDALTGIELWEYAFGSTSSSMNPTIYDGNLILTSYGARFVNASTGKLNGFFTQDKFTGSSPVVMNDIMYYGSGSDGYIKAFDLKNKRQKWATFTDYWADSSPTIIKNTIVISIQNGNALKAFDLETGKQKWEKKSMNGKANPCTYENAFIASAWGAIESYDAETGTKRWSFSIDDSESVSSPTESNGIIYVGSNSSYAYAISATDGKLKWKIKTNGNIDSSPFVDGNFVYFYSKDSYLYALDKNTGVEKWKFQIGKPSDYSSFFKDSSPVVVGGILYLQGRDKKAYALNSTTGVKLWEFADAFYQDYSSPCVIDKSGKVYHSSMSGMQN